MNCTKKLDYGRRLISHLIDERADKDWKQPFTSLSRSADPIDGFDDITYRQYANAINHCAWWMQSVLGKSHDSNTMAYTEPSDIRYGKSSPSLQPSKRVPSYSKYSSTSVKAQSTIAVCSLA